MITVHHQKILSRKQKEKNEDRLFMIYIVPSLRSLCVFPLSANCTNWHQHCLLTFPSTEGSSSKLNIMKNRLRSSMGQERLDSLMLKSVELDITKSLNIEDLVKRSSDNALRRWYLYWQMRYEYLWRSLNFPNCLWHCKIRSSFFLSQQLGTAGINFQKNQPNENSVFF